MTTTTPPYPPAADDVLAAIAEASGWTVADLRGGRRFDRLCAARMAAVEVFKVRLKMSYPECAAALGMASNSGAWESHRKVPEALGLPAGNGTDVRHLILVGGSACPPIRDVATQPPDGVYPHDMWEFRVEATRLAPDQVRVRVTGLRTGNVYEREGHSPTIELLRILRDHSDTA